MATMAMMARTMTTEEDDADYDGEADYECVATGLQGAESASQQKKPITAPTLTARRMARDTGSGDTGGYEFEDDGNKFDDGGDYAEVDEDDGHKFDDGGD